MATVSNVRTNELMVELTAKEVIEAIEQRAWCAAVKDNLQVSVEETLPRFANLQQQNRPTTASKNFKHIRNAFHGAHSAAHGSRSGIAIAHGPGHILNAETQRNHL